MKVDLIVKNAKEIITLQGPKRPRKGEEMNQLGILNNVSIVIKEGTIIDITSHPEQYQSESEIDAQNKVIMPGFVDSHTHPVFVNTRENEFEMRIQGKSYVEISQSGGGILSSIKAVREASEEELYQSAKKRIIKMLQMGTTSIEAKSGYGLTTESELKMLKVLQKLKQELPVDIKTTFLGAHEYPAEYKNNHEGYISILLEEMLPQCKPYADYCDVFCEKHVYSIEESRRILTAAKEMGYELKMHADEIELIGGAELAAEVKAISADHLGAASEQGMIAMRDAGVIAVLLPGTIFSLGMKQYARARDMIRLGLPVALATDFNPGSCNCDSMQFVMTLATLQMKMTVAEALTASTINSAYAIGLGDRVGSLEIGKQADLLIMDIPGYRYLPYHFGSNNVETVIKKGIVAAKN
jgi:imidazolonepropionase